MGITNQPPDLLPGTLDLLILQTLMRGSMHGYGIAVSLRVVSEEILQIGESSLYPALQRLLLNGWVKAEWGVSDNNRRARYYTLTAAGRKRLAAERQEFDELTPAIHKVLNATWRARTVMQQLIRRIWYALRQRQLGADLADEIEFHRTMKQR